MYQAIVQHPSYPFLLRSMQTFNHCTVPLIWHLIINLSRSVPEVSDATAMVYLRHTYMYIPNSRFKTRKLNLFMLENTCFII
jgi:hypothetical protein